MKCKTYFGINCISLFFSRPFTVSFIVAMISLLGSLLKVIEKLRPFARRSVGIWINFLEYILITHSLSSTMLVALCVTLSLLISSSNFRLCLFFVKSNDFLYEFAWSFSTKWKIMMLVLNLSRLSWLKRICSCNKSFPVYCKLFNFIRSCFFFLVVALLVEFHCATFSQPVSQVRLFCSRSFPVGRRSISHSKRSLITYNFSWRVNLFCYEHWTDKQIYFYIYPNILW